MYSVDRKAYKRAKADFQNWIDLCDTVKTQRDTIYTFRKRGKPAFPRFGSYEGMLINYTPINKNITAVLYLDKRFKVRHEVIPAKVFEMFLNEEDHGRFFKIKYELYGNGNKWELFREVKWWNNDSKPIWYEDQYFRELVELVIDDPKEKEEVLALADDRKRKLSKL